jgi:hypothetical protein
VQNEEKNIHFAAASALDTARKLIELLVAPADSGFTKLSKKSLVRARDEFESCVLL